MKTNEEDEKLYFEPLKGQQKKINPVERSKIEEADKK